jgi:hypothetical protein
MKNQIKNRITKVAEVLAELSSALEADKTNKSYEFLDKILGGQLQNASMEQQELLFKARAELTQSWKSYVQATKLKTANYVHDPLMLKKHENEAAATIQNLGSQDADKAMKDYSEKVKEVSNKRDFSAADQASMKNLLKK